MSSNEPEITNHKSITDNSVILSAVETLLSSAGFDINDLNVALDVLKNAKDQSLVDKKQDKVFWLDKTFIYEHIDDAFIYKRATSISGRWYLRIYDEKNNIFREPNIPNNEIGIIHLAAGMWKNGVDMRVDKNIKVNIKTLEGKILEKSLRNLTK